MIFKSEKRYNKIVSVLKQRQTSFHVILENIHDPHNVSAILRSCDAAGVGKVSLVYNIEQFPKIGKKSSASAYKWIERAKYKSIEECYDALHKDGFTICVSALGDNIINLYDLDLTNKYAVVLGNEHRGVSREAEELADIKFKIPMHGMVQSLNVSVAAAVILFETARQRKVKSMYDTPSLDPEQLRQSLDAWLKK